MSYSPLRDAVNTLGRVAKTALTKGKIVSPESTSEIRLVFCDRCVEFRAGYCKLCKCNMALKTKLIEARCPKGLW